MLSLAAVNSPEDLTKWHDRLLQRLKSPDVALRATLPLAHIRMPWDPQGEPASASKASTSKGKQRQPQKAKKKLDTAPTSQSWTVEPKIDGLAVRLTYRGGQLIEAATRGDGKEGEDVTANAAMVANIPQLVCPPTSTTTTASKTGSNGSNLPAEFEVRGEVFISHADLAKLNEEQAVAGLPAYSNARNLAAGSLRLLDPAVTAKRRLSCIAYQLVLPPNCSAPLASQWEALQWLQDHGFSTNADNHRCANFEGAKLVAGRWMFGRDKLGYDADGVVLKLDDLGLQRALGDIGGDPRWAIAWKFPANEAITRLLGITLTLGRMGQVTPVAILEPVVISNIRIMRATLHSIGDVLAKGFCVGDQVVIRRSNDVIPQVMRPILELRDGSQTAWEAPTHCPACKGTLTWRQDNKRVLMCGNAACSALAGKQVEHWAACCVPGLGKATVQQLVEDGLVKTVPDLYKLTEGQLMTLQGFAAKKAANLLAAIEASKSQPLPKLIHGLGIPSIGMTLAERIVQIITTLPELTTGRLMEDPSWAAVPAGARATLDSWSGEPTNAELVQALYDLGVGPRTASTSGGAPQGNNAAIMGSKSSSSSAGLPDVKGTPLLGKSVVITGSFQYVDRDLARTTVQEIARKAGASVANGVSGRTDLLLTGNRPAEAKVAKAQKLGIEVVDKAAFWQIITGETPA
ncbi:hypothetical protein WJX72_000015 [[Myrmecia] bisecta]|uniref:DNA ligase (NAD(+)) n=1 Tax=[Myrmecia] bisecta TaxID=41462 RepID=A0AAW1Q9M7_9CHLO